MSDWTTDAADAIERSVSMVRDKTVTPAYSATRYVVYGLLAALIGIPAAILAVIGLFRGLVLVWQGYVWAAWLTLAGIFLAAGAFCWTKRNK
jgi:hypothetical protein